MSASAGVHSGSTRSARPLAGWALIALAVGVALAIYFVGADHPPLSTRGTWFIVGEAIGIAAAVLLALAAVLAVRLRPLEWLFGDMTQVYVAHGICGLTMLGLVTIHPLTYVVGTLVTGAGVRPAAHMIVPFHLVVLDWISWILIVLAMLPTLYVRMRYDWWRFTHLLLGAAIVVTGVSLTLTSTAFDTFNIPALRIYLFAVFGVSIASILYVAIVRRLAEPKHEYVVDRIERHPQAHAIELHLSPVGKPLRYRPGQFTYVDLLDDRLQINRDYEAHPYSIVSIPGSDDGLVVVVESMGPYTERIQQIAERDDARALVHGAYGRLDELRRPGSKQLWLAGGVGVTPFLALAADMVREGSPHAGDDVVFVVFVERAEQAFFHDRLQEYAERNPNFRFVLWCTGERGHCDAQGLAAVVPDIAERRALMSGPEGLLATLRRDLHDAGVRHVAAELEIGPPRRWRNAPVSLQVLRWVVTVEIVAFVLLFAASTIGRAVT